MVEKANHTAAQRWWRNLADDVTIEEAQASLDRFCVTKSDTRRRVIDGLRATVAVHAAREPLTLPPAPFPATLTVERQVSAQALVAFRGNRYSTPPEIAFLTVTVTWLLGASTIDITTASGIVIARHRIAGDGAGLTIRDHHHVSALDLSAMNATNNTGPPHRRKQRIPPGETARAAAAAITNGSQSGSSQNCADSTVVDLSAYAKAAHGRNTLT